MPVLDPRSATPSQWGFSSKTGALASFSPSYGAGDAFPIGGNMHAASDQGKPYFNAKTGEVQTPFTRMDALLERHGGVAGPPPSNPMDIWDSMNRDFPDQVLDPTDITTKIIIHKMSNSDRWPMRLFRLRKTNKLEVGFTQWIFSETGMTRVPEESTGRYSSNYKRHFREGLIRIGHQLRMEMNHMETPEGSLEWTHKLWQVAFAIEEGACHDIIVACLANDAYDPQADDINRVWRKAETGDGTLMSKFRPEFQSFACINKGGDQQHLRHTFLRGEAEFALNNQGLKPNVAIFPAGVGAYWAESKEANNKFAVTGKPDADLGMSRSDTLYLPDGVRYHESRSFRLGQYVVEKDPLLRNRSTGGYWFCNDEHTRGIPVDQHKIGMYDMRVQDEPMDRLRPFSYKKNFAHLGIYNNYEDGVDVTTLKNNHPSLSLAGTILMGFDTETPIATYGQMWSKKISSAHYNELQTSIARKPELLAAMARMNRIPFRWSTDDKKAGTTHLDPMRPYFALHRTDPYTIRRSLFNTAAGVAHPGPNLDEYGKELDKKISSRTSAYHAKRAVVNPQEAWRNQRSANNRNSYNTTDEDNDDDMGVGYTGPGRAQGRQQQQQRQRQSNTSSAPSLNARIKNVIDKASKKHDVVYGGVQEVVAFAAIVDKKTNNEVGALEKVANYIENTNDEYPGSRAFKVIGTSVLYDDLIYATHKRHEGGATALETFVKEKHGGNYHFKEDETSLETEAAAINATQCFMVEIPGNDTLHHVQIPLNSRMDILANLKNSSNYVTLSSGLIALMAVNSNSMVDFCNDDRATGAFTLRRPSTMNPGDLSLSRSNFRLDALHYNTTLSCVAALIKGFPFLQATTPKVDKCIEGVKRICNTPRFGSSDRSTYDLNVGVLQTNGIANCQVAVQPFIRSLLLLVEQARSGADDETLRAALYACFDASANTYAFIRENGIDFNSLSVTKSAAPIAAAGNGRGRGGLISSPRDSRWADAVDKAFSADKQKYMTAIEGNAPVSGFSSVSENEYASYVHGGRDDQAVTLFRSALFDVFDALPEQVGQYGKMEAFMILARLAHMTILARDSSLVQVNYSPIHQAEYLLRHFAINGATSGEVTNAKVWLEKLVNGRAETDSNPLYHLINSEINENRSPLDISRVLAGTRVTDPHMDIDPDRITRLANSGDSQGNDTGLGPNDKGLFQYIQSFFPDRASYQRKVDDYVAILKSNAGFLNVTGPNFNTFLNGIGSVQRIYDARDLAVAIEVFAAKVAATTVDSSSSNLDISTVRVEAANQALTALQGMNEKHPAWGNLPITLPPNWPTLVDFLIKVPINALTDTALLAAYANATGGQRATGINASRRSPREVEQDVLSALNQAPGEEEVMTEDEFEKYPIEIRKKVVKQIIDHYPIEDGRLQQLLNDFDVKPPFGYVAYRPFRTYLMGCMILMYTTEKDPVGVLSYIPFRMTVGEDANTQMVHGQITGWTRATVLAKQRIYKVPDVYCKYNLYGNDLQIIDWAQSQIVGQQLARVGTYNGSVILTPRWINFECNSQPMDVTGQFPVWMKASQSEKINCRYELADHICSILKIRRSTINGTPWEDSFNMSNSRTEGEDGVNTVCFQSVQQRYNHNTGQFDDTIVEQGHWGPEVGDGCCAGVREGYPGIVKTYEYNTTCHVAKRL